MINLRNQLNFSGGPGALPDTVLQQVQQAIISLPETGLSVLGMSHRSDWFAAVVEECENNIRTLLGLDKHYHVLLLQGGATQQFSMIPMTLLQNQTVPADYIHSGYWSGKSIHEAQKEGAIRTVWSGASSGFTRLPSDAELNFAADAPYCHYVSNETVEGLQFHRLLGHDHVPRICDMSSDFLSRPIEADQFSLIYAHAQKNMGPAGVTIVVMRDDLLEGIPTNHFPGMFAYRNHIQAHSNSNTPPVFAIYVVLLVTRWILQDIGGLENMAKLNQHKADTLYHCLDESNGFYAGRAAEVDRSLMNVSFKLATPALEKQFLSESSQVGFSGLAGHRSTGGMRASIYNGLTLAAVEQLVEFMMEFQKQH